MVWEALNFVGEVEDGVWVAKGFGEGGLLDGIGAVRDESEN